MTEWMADVGRIPDCVQDLQQVSARLMNISDDISRLSRGFALEDRSVAGIQRRISGISQNLENLSGTGYEFSDVLNEAMLQYKKAEEQICNRFGGGGSDFFGTVQIGTEESNTDSSDWLTNIWKLLSSAGILGKLFSIGGTMLDGQGNLLIDLMESGKYLSDIIGDIADAGSDFNWKHLFGLVIDNSTQTTDYWEAFSEQMGEYGIKGSIAKKIGAIFTLFASAVENFGDDSMTWQRALEETIGETAVKIVEDVAITTAVGVAFAAAEISVPVIITALIGSAIGIGVDAGCEWVTKQLGETNEDGSGKDVAELISDAMINYINEGMDNIKEWWTNLFGNVRPGHGTQLAW